MEVKIKWENYAKNSYTFGSRISFKDGQVIFDNPLMSPSFALTSWSSRTNFQAQRTQSDLPLLKRGSTYQVKLVADIHPANSLYVKVIYFDRLGETIGFEVLKDDHWQFTYPRDAFHYTIELINAGCERVVFDQLILADYHEDPRDGIDLSDLAVYFPQDNSRLNVIFLEADAESVDDLPKQTLEKLGNVVLVGDREAVADYYLSPAFVQKLSKHLSFYHDHGHTQFNFIAYGPRGALAALAYAAKFPSQVYLASPLPDKTAYREGLNQRPDLDTSLLLPLIDRLTYASNVHGYGQSSPSEKINLVGHCFNRAYCLRSLPLLMTEAKPSGEKNADN